MFNERRLVAELKHAYKYGYNIYCKAGVLHIITTHFTIKTHLEEIPRKVLSILVEHVGYIPEDCAISCANEQTNQLLLEDALMPMVNISDFNEGQYAFNTRITYGASLKLFQKSNREIVGIDADYLSLLESPQPPKINISNSRAAWVGLGENTKSPLMLILNASYSKDNVQLNYLEQFDWRIKDESFYKIEGDDPAEADE